MTFKDLTEVGAAAVAEMDASFTSRQLGEVLHESMQYFPSWDRYRKPLRRGHTAGQVLRALREQGLVVRTPRAGRWQRVGL